MFLQAKTFQRRPSDLPVVPVADPTPVSVNASTSVPKADAPKESAPSRRPLSLALNTVLEGQGGESASNPPESRKKRAASQALPPVARPTSLSGGLALTPLMAKLSHLAIDRHGTTGIEETPRTEHKETSYPQRGEFFTHRAGTCRNTALS